MPRLFFLAAVAVLASPAFAHGQHADGGGALTLAEQQALKSAAAAYLRGDAGAGMQIVSPLLAKWSDEKVAAADALLAEHDLPPIRRQLAESRLAELKLNPSKPPRLSPRETLLVLPELHRELERALDAAKDHPVMADPLPRPANLEEYETLLWDAHVLDNQLLNAATISSYMTQLAGRLSRRDIAKLDDSQRTVAKADHAAVAARVEASQRELAERQIELRSDRLALAKNVLAELDLSPEKFQAAFAWQHDTALLEEFYRAAGARKNRGEDEGPRYLRDRLNQPEFFVTVGADAREAQRLAGGLTVKANLLVKGLHWWYRGRYGLGPLALGLAKHPAAIHSEAGQLGLFMPLEPPRPTNPDQLTADQTPQPLYDRRHHYWWAWEDRRVARNGFSETTTRETTEWEAVTQNLVLTSFW